MQTILRLNRIANDVYTRTVNPILEIAEARAAVFDIRRHLGRTQSHRDAEATGSAGEPIDGDFNKIDKSWRDYCSAVGNDTTERTIADRINLILSPSEAAMLAAADRCDDVNQPSTKHASLVATMICLINGVIQDWDDEAAYPRGTGLSRDAVNQFW